MDELKQKRRQRLLAASRQSDDKWQQFVDRFELKKAGAAPWEAEQLAKQHAGASHGERCIIAFLLHVWDPNHAWSCGKFDAIDALRTWRGGEVHRLFLEWAEDPWWP